MAAMPCCILSLFLPFALLPLDGAVALLDVPLAPLADEALPLIDEEPFPEDVGFELAITDEVSAPDVVVPVLVAAGDAAEDMAVALAVALPLASDDVSSTVF